MSTSAKFPSSDYRYITNIPEVRSGQAIIEGTRIGVHDVIGLLQTGESVESLVANCFPRLTRAQVYECLAYPTRIIGGRITSWVSASNARRKHDFPLDHDVPDDAAFALEAMGHQVTRLREVFAHHDDG